jgi:hypothetical protein
LCRAGQGYNHEQLLTVLKSDPLPYDETEGVKFRLTYEGKLFSEQNRTNPAQRGARANHKHEIRKIFHKQLKRFWSTYRPLGQRGYDKLVDGKTVHRAYSEDLGDYFSHSGYRFCPIITSGLALHCNLHILFLRADPPGAVLASGDMDNRLKTLFDALRMPGNASELGRYLTPDADEDPLYCLLEDDRLIVNLAVETDTLLEPLGAAFDLNDARLVISVEAWPYVVGVGNVDMIGG